MKKTAVVGLPDVLKVFARWLWSFARVNVYFLTSLDIENLIFRRKGLYLPQKLVMTPEEILTLLEEGRGDEIVWAEAETAGADFSGATFEGLDMQGADFSDANLAGATFVDCNLAGATFVGANLDGATFDGCNLDGADFADAQVENATFVEITGEPVNLEMELEEAEGGEAEQSFVDAELAGADFSGANLAGANFSGADLTAANLTDANLTDVALTANHAEQVLFADEAAARRFFEILAEYFGVEIPNPETQTA